MLPLFLFATGIENSYPTINGGKTRIDEMDTCGHYKHWRTDFDRVEHLGISYLRYGPPIHRTWLGSDRYDWTLADETFHDLRKRDIVAITDPATFRPDRKLPEPRSAAAICKLLRAFASRYPWCSSIPP
ncbi:MAG: hypothetical protein WKF37_08935 [Bryobacteraceae bacterium]